VPQWNCGCANCAEARSGRGKIRPRTQDSLAVSADGDAWVVCNASPDIGAQIESFSGLHPRAPRHSPIAAIVLTNGDVDHVLGLFCIRESYPLVVYATEAVWSGLEGENVLFKTLQRFPEHTTWRRLRLGEETRLAGADGKDLGLAMTARAIPGKRPVHLELGTQRAPSDEDNIGLFFRGDSGTSVAYVPGAAALDPLRALLAAGGPHAGASALLFDGTFWSDDELPSRGLGKGRARDMAHHPIGGPEGSLAGLARLAASRKIYTHINNTNPVLLEDSAERRAVTAAGWEVAYDGLEIDA
jgi:pyrroloquinoline quinone biosynthesis protein B